MPLPPNEPPVPGTNPEEHRRHIAHLEQECVRRGVDEAVQLLDTEADQDVSEVMTMLNPAIAVSLLWALPEERRDRILELVPRFRSEQWRRNHAYPQGTIGRLMEDPLAVFGPDVTVRDALQELRELVRQAFITYAYVTDPERRLLGVLVFRDLLFARESQPLRELMVPDPFFLGPEMTWLDAMREVLARHYPVYPVCDDQRRLVGVVRGQTLFQQQALEITAQAGSMVGVEKEERLSTPWQRSFRFRHPWLQFNLLTAFIAAAVVGFFEHTIDQIVALAVFLPVLAGQSGNTGCQALAVTLRGMTLGELDPGKAAVLVSKEAWLGFLNGAGVGITAAIGMLVFAVSKGHEHGLPLAFVVFLAMIGSCATSGISGALVPLTLKRLGADPATASSIFLTTATDVASMGLFLGLATWLIV